MNGRLAVGGGATRINERDASLIPVWIRETCESDEALTDRRKGPEIFKEPLARMCSVFFFSTYNLWSGNLSSLIMRSVKPISLFSSVFAASFGRIKY